MQAITKTLVSTNRHQCIGNLMGTRPLSVVAEFTTTKVRDEIASKSELLRYSNLHYIGIVANMSILISTRLHLSSCLIILNSWHSSAAPITVNLGNKKIWRLKNTCINFKLLYGSLVIACYRRTIFCFRNSQVKNAERPRRLSTMAHGQLQLTTPVPYEPKRTISKSRSMAGPTWRYQMSLDTGS